MGGDKQFAWRMEWTRLVYVVMAGLVAVSFAASLGTGEPGWAAAGATIALVVVTAILARHTASLVVATEVLQKVEKTRAERSRIVRALDLMKMVVEISSPDFVNTLATGETAHPWFAAIRDLRRYLDLVPPAARDHLRELTKVIDETERTRNAADERLRYRIRDQTLWVERLQVIKASISQGMTEVQKRLGELGW